MESGGLIKTVQVSKRNAGLFLLAVCHWQDTHPTGPRGHQFKEFNKKKCMKVLLQRCEEDKEASREQQRGWHQQEVFNIAGLNGTRWSKETAGTWWKV